MPPTDTVTHDADTHERYRARRDDRYDALHRLWRITDVKRVAHCRRFVSDGAAGVTIKVSGTPGTPAARAGVSGLQTCGSVWACPVCSESINAQRQADLEAGIRAWVAAGHAVVFGTFTLRHHAGQALLDLWSAVSPVWNATVGGTGWHGGKRQIGDKARFGVAGWCRVVEVKHGESGWHPHVHALFFLERDLGTVQLEDLRSRLFGRWDRALGRHGLSSLEFDRTGQAVAVDLRRVTNGGGLADYFSKATYTAASAAAYEVTGSHSKKAGKGGRTPFQILADLGTVKKTEAGHVDVNTGELLDADSEAAVARDLRLWLEWERVSRGRRQLTWSKGLRDLLALGVEKTDEEIVEEADLAGDDVMMIESAEWDAGRWARRLPELLRWAEAGTLAEHVPVRLMGSEQRRSPGVNTA